MPSARFDATPTEIVSYLKSGEFVERFRNDPSNAFHSAPRVWYWGSPPNRICFALTRFSKDKRNVWIRLEAEGGQTHMVYWERWTGIWVVSMLIGSLFCVLPGLLILVRGLLQRASRRRRAHLLLRLVAERFGAEERPG